MIYCLAQVLICLLVVRSIGKNAPGTAGVAAFAAEAKYDSFLLDIITFVSGIALATRIILGYRRMSQRCP